MNSNAENLIHNGTRMLPEAISTYADRVDTLFYFIYWASVALFIALFLVTFYFIIRFRRKRKEQVAEKQIIHNTTLEVVWTVIPLILVMIIFVWSYKDYMVMSVPPRNALEIHVTGKKWFWEFEYPNGYKETALLRVPQGQNVKLIMTSGDVIHSFFVPNFRMKRDVIPNRYTKLWFNAERAGKFQIFCTEYCGDNHSHMLADLEVMPASEYEEWIAKAASADDDMPLAELGKQLYEKQFCYTCHSLDGSPKIGPTWKGLYESKRPLHDGSTVVADETYLHESIVDPKAKSVKGYYPSSMPSFSSLTDRQVSALIEYIKTVK